MRLHRDLDHVLLKTVSATNLKSKQNGKFFDTQEMNKGINLKFRQKKTVRRQINGVGNSVIELRRGGTEKNECKK